MKYSTHFIFGVTLALVVSNFMGSPIELVATASLSSLLPDIDHPQSFIGSRFIKISSYIWNKWGHRTITHSAIAATLIPFLLAGPFYLLFRFFDYETKIYILWLGGFIGYLSHLIADALNPQGIAFLYPIVNRRFPVYKNKESAITMGSNDESWFRFFIKVIGFLLSIKLIWNLIRFS